MMSEEQDLGFLEHLEALRRHLIRAIAALVVGFVVAYAFHEQLLTVLVMPVMAGLRDHGIYALQTISVTEGIMTYIKAAMVAGVALSMPLILRELWLFIRPGLYPKERMVVLPALFVVFLFFLAGMLFSYFVFVPFVVDFLAGMTPSQAMLVPRFSDVLSLSLLFYLVFGVIFEVPLVMFILAFLGVFKVQQYLRFSKYFVVAAFIIGALFSPPDPLSQVLLAVPLCFLYGLGILASLAVGRSGGVGGALRTLGGMALLLIGLTVAGYYGARSARTQWVVSPWEHLGPGTCVRYLDTRVIGKGPREIRELSVDGPKGWLGRFRPPVPAGIWCLDKGGHRFTLELNPQGAGFLIEAEGTDLGFVEPGLPSEKWPRETHQKQGTSRLKTWLPSPGIRGFLDSTFLRMKGLCTGSTGGH
jgi:sec-independent protein translocase protein TatC